MTEDVKTVNKRYREAMWFGIGQQVFLLLLTGTMLDRGLTASMFLYAAAAYWVGFCIIRFRRSRNMGRNDILFIKWGTVVLFAIAFFVAPMMWRIRESL